MHINETLWRSFCNSTHAESLCRTPEIYTMLYVNYVSIKKRKMKKSLGLSNEMV